MTNPATESSSYTPVNCERDQLWLPGMTLEHDFPVATPEQLVEAWECYDGRTPEIVEGVLGVFVPPSQPPKAIASVDLCEVIRETSIALDHATGYEPSRRGHYSKDRWFLGDHHGEHGDKFDMSFKTAVFQAIMSRALVPPVDDIEAIKLIMMRWRAEGVFVIANTSTLSGCEVGTITKQLKTYVPDCFDGIVFPRNHSGNEGDMTKARALNLVTDQAKIDAHAVPLVHIDDTVHHNDTMLRHFSGHPNITVVIPRHADNEHGGLEYMTNTPLEAFQRADAFFNLQEVS